jgi:stage V sporulation protein G
MGEGDFRDIAHPLVSETRNKIKEAIFAEYERVLEEKLDEHPVEATSASDFGG